MNRSERALWTEAAQAGDLFGGSPSQARSSRKADQRERRELRALVEAAALRWWRPYLQHVANERITPQDRNALRGCAIAEGFPDLLLWLRRPVRGRAGAFHPLAACELKAPGGATGEAQEPWLGVLSLLDVALARVYVGWREAFDALDAYAGERREWDPPPPFPEALGDIAQARAARAVQDRASTPRGPARAPRGAGAGDALARGGGGDPLSGKSRCQ